MPRVSRRKKRRVHGYGEWHIHELETGIAWEFLSEDEAFHGDREAMRAAWEELRDEILARWVIEHPGTRPWAWWEFDATERRRRTDGKPHPFDNPERQAHVDRIGVEHPEYKRNAYKLYYGWLRSLCFTDDFKATCETQAEYLERLGLMDEQEKHAAEEAERAAT